MKKESKGEEKKTRNITGALLVILQGVLTAAILAFLWIHKFLPTALLVTVGACLLVMLVIAVIMACSRHGRVIGRVYSFLLVLVLFAASATLYQMDRALGKVTGGEKLYTESVSVMVLEGSMAREVADVQYQTFGLSKEQGSHLCEQALSTLQNRFGAEVKKRMYPDYLAMARALFSGEIDAMMISDSYIPLLSRVIEGFSEEVRVISTYTYSSDVVPAGGAKESARPSSFCVYVCGSQEESVLRLGRSAMEYAAVLGIGMDSRRAAFVEIPANAYVSWSLPEEEPVFDLAGCVSLQGSGAVRAVTSHLFGAPTEYELRVDLSRLRGLETAFSEASLLQKIVMFYETLGKLEEVVSTDVPKSLLYDLLRAQIDRSGSFSVTHITLTGEEDTLPVYSFGTQEMPVIRLDETVTESARAALAKVREPSSSGE